ncbi:hypothetical protein MVEG_06163 [Podila verticillata NRRL 6337]|nr:hypothetical protein MVEG_06163 [Podila verticillata NRRL 6337]
MLRPTPAKIVLARPRSPLRRPGSTAPHDHPEGLTQTIGHTIDGEAFAFEVPVTTTPTGTPIVLLEHVLDLFPNTVGLRLKDQTSVPFMTTTEDVLMVPMRVKHYPSEILHIVTAAPRPATPPPPPSLPIRPRPLPSTNPFRAMLAPTSTEPLPMLDMDPFGLESLATAFATTTTTTTNDPPPLPARAPPVQAPKFSLATEGLAELIAQSIPNADLPVPRLFIALPDAKPRDFDDAHLARTLSAQQDSANSNNFHGSIHATAASRTFRLYFLCDCGEGATFPATTLSTGTTTTTTTADEVFGKQAIDLGNCIHIADQTGYEILNLQQFASDLGAYSLRFLYGLRDGIDKIVQRASMDRSRVAIPPLDEALYTDVLQPFTWDLKERVSTAIHVLESLHTPSLVATTTQEVDLTRLWEYVQGLKVGREQYVQSMYRMLVHDGTTRWICDAHYTATFDYLKEDRDVALWQCKDILGDDTGADPVESLDGTDLELTMGELGSEEDDFSYSAETKTKRTKPVSFDDRKKHLKLVGVESAHQMRQLARVLVSAYMVQRVSLSLSFASCCGAVENGHRDEIMAVITDVISSSKVGLWDVLVHPDITDSPVDELHVAGTPSMAPPPYSFDNDASSSSSPSPSMSSISSRSGQIAKGKQRERSSSSSCTKQLLHPLSDLFILSQIKSLELPDLGKSLFKGLNPSPGEFPHLQQFKLWGSETVEIASSAHLGAGPTTIMRHQWNAAGLGALLCAFSNLTELRISQIDLSKNPVVSTGPGRVPSSPNNVYGVDMPLMEVVQSLLCLPRLSVLELSDCGLDHTHCALLSRTLTMSDSRITHLNIHNNWLGDDGLAELIWAVGPHLFSLDARHCGFGNASAFALASVLEAHNEQTKRGHQQHHPPGNTSSSVAQTSDILKILKLQESSMNVSTTSNSVYAQNRRSSLLNKKSSSGQLDVHGRQNLVRALESLAPLELMMSMEMGFQDEDFASAFVGMRRLESLERLEVGYSNFGPLALAAMVRTLQATSCRIRYLGVRSTLLTEEEQKQALDQILSI